MTSEPLTKAAGTDAERTGTDTGRRAVGWVFVAAIVLVAFNLRPAIVAVGPLAGEISSDTGLSSSAVGLLTTVPLICLGAFAAAAPAFARRVGFERAVLAALALIVGGIALRLSAPTAALFAGTVLAGSGIALANVLVPALLKRDFAARIGVMMAMYSVALQTGATVASGATVPLRSALGIGWRPALALWALPALAAVLGWLPFALRRAGRSGGVGQRYDVWRSRLGWSAAGFLGLQSAVYFSLTAWLPSLLQSGGMSVDRAGLMLSVVSLAGILGGLPVPVLAARMGDARPLVVGAVAVFAVGLVGLLVAPVALALVWAILLGLAQGASLALALTLFTLRSRSADGAAQLSGTAQTGGYLIAALGPLSIGAVHGLTGGWSVPVIALIVVLVPLTVLGLATARPRYLEDEATPKGT